MVASGPELLPSELLLCLEHGINAICIWNGVSSDFNFTRSTCQAADLGSMQILTTRLGQSSSHTRHVLGCPQELEQ